MTTSPNTPTRWRPRFSVRTLAVIVSLVCAYAACWGPTKNWGEEDLMQYLGQRIGVDDHELFARSPYSFTAIAPLVVEGADGSSGTAHYFFWFFGHLDKLPYERKLSAEEHEGLVQRQFLSGGGRVHGGTD